MPSDTGGRLRQLGLALLNATLLLIALVLLLLVVLVWQLRGFADDLRTGLRSDLALMQAQVEATRETARASLQELPDSPQAQAARQELARLVDRLEALDPAAAAPGETDALLQRRVLVIIATAAQGLVGELR
ncbi:MAG: hypothetical protein ACK4GT_09280 [Pararhodobacter sp.]